jgi:hypothetical protein
MQSPMQPTQVFGDAGVSGIVFHETTGNFVQLESTHPSGTLYFVKGGEDGKLYRIQTDDVGNTYE